MKSPRPFAHIVVHRKFGAAPPRYANDEFIERLRAEADAGRSPADYLCDHLGEPPDPEKRLAGLKALKELADMQDEPD